ncbi:uncharacterized protein LOC118239058 isoform X2 [Cricetulus griseus]|uniref:Uncharacterized protein LOC118239058 isoform X2 n=1 Tax=Cricetulus griseus TaxID=10029 RepID=A0A9J7KAG0_CRIGR|nr:uncharacterized protein LOC118239058 isoform X2 [Cricetulus griseus]XP_035316898.1 uncharacterized protein LOC118239058 isoform X2 [Cricetulus griseus]
MDQNSSGLQSKRTAAPHSRQNKTQDSLKETSNLPDDTQGHQANMQARMPISHPQEHNSRDLSTSTPMTRRVSIQEPPATLFIPRKFSTPASFPYTIPPQRSSTQETQSQSPQLETQDIQSVAYNRWLRSREGSSHYHYHELDILNSQTLCSVQSEISSLHIDTGSHLSLIQPHKPNRKQTRPNVDVPPSITCSPEASVRSFESFVWDSKESLTGLSYYSMSSQSNLGSFFKLSNSSPTTGSSRAQSKRWSLLPMGWKLLLEAKKISRYLSLVLTVAGMLMLNLIALWQPWIHFQVPLVPSWDPTGPKSIPIDTIFFMRCPDISCMNEYDKNAYLLDLAWACLLVSGVMSFCVCMGLISTIFFPSTNMPLMDFSLFICSLMTGLFSYLNYMNFWSILAVQALWS